MRAAVTNRVRRGFYLDSVALMRLALGLEQRERVLAASLMIGTRANLALLEEARLLTDGGRAAGPDDLVIAVRALDADAAEAAADAALDTLVAIPRGEVDDGGRSLPRGIGGALHALPDARLVLVSVPGEFAASEAHRALDRGLDVMIFSDNVPLADEIALKRRGRARGRLVMGPDCGTALIGGVPLGFANVVPDGPVGIVAAAGTGLQEVACLLGRAGVGISHGIGVGGRDLSAAVAGIATLGAIERLADDPGTERLLVVSKTPAEDVALAVEAALAHTGKPAAACFLGLGSDSGGDVPRLTTLLAAAEHMAGAPLAADFDPAAIAARHATRPGGVIHGLFSGGTLCAEAQVVLMSLGLAVGSNVPVPGASPLPARHRLIDLGADEFTRGRPHPMLEPEVRLERLKDSLGDPEVGVVLLDVVLGYGAHPDPAGAIVRCVTGARPKRPPVVASVTGTQGDPQGYAEQCAALAEVGVLLAPSNANAAALAAALIG